MQKRVCVFCGSSAGRKGEFLGAARALGTHMAALGYGLVYGGGRRGMMGAIADAVLESGGEVIGVVPDGLFSGEVVHDDLTELRTARDMHARKALMRQLSLGYVALPGGMGTLEELFEVWTWSQLGIHNKPVVLLNARGYWDPLMQMIERSFSLGFIQEQYRDLLSVAAVPEEAVDQLGSGGHG